MRYGLRSYQGRIAETSKKYGDNLRRKNQLSQVLEFLEKLKPLKYLGATSKHEILMLLDSVVKDEQINFVEIGHLPIVKKCMKSLEKRLEHFYETFIASLANCFN